MEVAFLIFSGCLIFSSACPGQYISRIIVYLLACALTWILACGLVGTPCASVNHIRTFKFVGMIFLSFWGQDLLGEQRTKIDTRSTVKLGRFFHTSSMQRISGPTWKIMFTN
jgi:hypothetical protein